MKPYLLIALAQISCINVNAQTKRGIVYDTRAKFTNGDADFVTYLAKHVKIPEHITRDAKAQLTIRIKIDEEGKASVDTISKSVSPEVDAEFTKVIQAAPRWIPAKLKGKNVAFSQMAYFNVDINKSSSTMGVFPLNAREPLSKDKIYAAVDKNPSFPGGEKGFAEFLVNNIQYPELARSNNVMGRAFVQFVVERDGSLTDFNVLRDPGSGLGDEALRVLRKSPKWTPGSIRDTVVRVQFTVPINFSRR